MIDDVSVSIGLSLNQPGALVKVEVVQASRLQVAQASRL
jgi:hypothetical protein